MKYYSPKDFIALSELYFVFDEVHNKLEQIKD